MTKRIERVKYFCSFCGKPDDRVLMVIAGPNGVYICDECVDYCTEIVAERRAGVSPLKQKPWPEA